MNSLIQKLLAISIAVAFQFGGSASAKDIDKVVYHIDSSTTQATKGLRNIRNHLDVVPSTKIVVVTHADGVDCLFDGAKDPKNPNIDYGALVSSLKSRGVRFEVREITLKNRNLKREQFS